MKPVGSFTKWMACGVAVAGMLVSSSAQAAVGKAVVRAVRGTAEFSDQAGAWKPLKVGKVLGPGSSVRAGVSSQADLFLGENGPVVRVTSDTTLALNRLEIDRNGADVVIETMLDLKTGTILGNVKKLAAASKYEVKTPYTVCAIRGTEYQISADGVHHVITGSVMIAYTNPKSGAVTTHTVNEGQSFVPPVDPNVPTAVPQVLPTSQLPPTVAPPQAPPPPTAPTPEAPVTIVPEPVQFVSPGTGTEVNKTANAAAAKKQ
ncbi:MAG: hypothetical protein EXS30_01380 [Pedosphaera sp.]|nr:hypothetical protein [Pedosphaera sp.]